MPIWTTPPVKDPSATALRTIKEEFSTLLIMDVRTALFVPV